MCIYGFQYILCCGSTNKSAKDYNCDFSFQYILCCGSTLQRLDKIIRVVENFNTSYVVVQHLSAYLTDVEVRFQYILCCGSTKNTHKKSETALLFQYILCCGSTAADRLRNGFSQDFNTSYVVVQHEDAVAALERKAFQYILCCGSTSSFVSSSFIVTDFNTSYVVVQPLLVCDCYFLLY